MDNITVSVLLITYNANWDKLRTTLESILMQKGVAFEVIVADDGSKIRWDEALTEIFFKYQFDKYRLVNSKVNVGTVKNLYNGLQQVRGKYCKAISPGDMLYEEDTLRKWASFMDEHDGAMSFGDAVYYNCDESNRETTPEIQVLQVKNAPANVDIFEGEQKRKRVFVDYLLANDTILGATIMMRTDIMKEYLSRFVDRVKYAEDYMVRNLIFDNRKVLHYPKKTIWYEYGLGISTSKNDKWARLLFQDFESSNSIMAEEKIYADALSKKYAKFLKKDIQNGALRKIYKCLLFPGVIYWRIRGKVSGRMTPVDADKSFIEKLIG